MPISQYQIAGVFHILDRQLMTSPHKMPPIAISLCIFRGAIQQVRHLEKGTE